MFKVNFSFEDLVRLHFSDSGYLKQILGVSLRVEESLINAGFETVKDIISVSKEQLIKLNGIGSKSATKILAKIEEVKAIKEPE